MEENKFLPKLSQNLLEILDDDEYYYDITIEVGNVPYIKIFRAHMVILNYRSPYFRRILSTNKEKNDGTLTHIKLSNILPETFQVILRYIYGGKLSLKDYDTSDIIKILSAASELSLQELILHLQSFLIKNKTKWLEQNFNLVYQMSFENDSFLMLQKFCTELMSKEPEKIFKSSNFTSISEKSLVSLIQHDNPRMNETQIWENVLKWGIAQNPELSSDPTSYLENDFHSLKNTLKRCIPFIEFNNFTYRELLDKVLPFKKILTKELFKGLFQKSEPSNITKEVSPTIFDSKVITLQHVELISKWIDRLEITDEIKNSCEFKLMLRGSRDGFSPREFHEVCDKHSPTVIIIKVKDSNEILGGYNPTKWKSDYSYNTTKNSFIFSFNDRIENYILSRVMNEQNAIYNDFWYGPSFGKGDLYMISELNSTGCSKKVSYEKPIRETDKFLVEEYEVFKLYKTDA